MRTLTFAFAAAAGLAVVGGPTAARAQDYGDQRYEHRDEDRGHDLLGQDRQDRQDREHDREQHDGASRDDARREHEARGEERRQRYEERGQDERDTQQPRIYVPTPYSREAPPAGY